MHDTVQSESRTRYREARTLVRKLTPVAGQSREDFKANRRRLRRHFEVFNQDASELCQWLMAVNPNGKNRLEGAREFWEFFLFPAADGSPEAVKEGDRKRRQLMDYILGLAQADSVPPALIVSAETVKNFRRTAVADALFTRLRDMLEAHRLVLLKATAEWVVSRYQRQRESWETSYNQWHKEREEFENTHPELTESIREDFNEIFREIGTSESGIVRKSPRVCTHERMRGGLDNCEYAGEKCGPIRHGPLCVKFLRELELSSRVKFSNNKKRKQFVERALKYLECRADIDDKDKRRRRTDESKKKLAIDQLALFVRGQLQQTEVEQAKNPKKLKRISAKSPTPEQAKDHRKRLVQNIISEFQQDWSAYLALLEVREDTLLAGYKKHGGLPHCTSKGDVKHPCLFNKHTNDCVQYKARAAQLTTQALVQEQSYREWRGQFLYGPHKPIFKYPSAKVLPMPKIFGHDFWEADFSASTIRLRGEDGEWLTFGFMPWPRRYTPNPRVTPEAVTSIQVSFVGNRARIGFRFDVPHKPARLNLTQDEIDELRSRDFPRASQNDEYMAAMLRRVKAAFPGEAEKGLRLLAVDLGGKEAAWALLEGRSVTSKGGGLTIVKRDDKRLHEHWPKIKDDKGKEKDDPRGLSPEHVIRHRTSAEQGMKQIANHRLARLRTDEAVPFKPASLIGEHDQRGLFVHMDRMVRDWVRLNVSQIMKLATEHEVDVIVVDGSRRAVVPPYSKLDTEEGPVLTEKQRKAVRAFGQIRHKLREKAVEHGMRVVTVPEEGTSSICHACGKPQENAGLLGKNKRNRLFVCEHCGTQANSDLNAAAVLGRTFWGELTPWRNKRDEG